MTNDYADKNAELINSYLQTRDHKILCQLVSLNYPLVVKLSQKFKVQRDSVPDLLQEGCLGLIEGINKFEANRGAILYTYISYWIKAYMFKFVVHSSHIARLGLSTDESKLFYNLKKEQEKLKNKNVPVEDELEYISKEMNIDLDKVKLIDGYNKSKITSIDKIREYNISNNNTPDKLCEELNSFKILSSKIEEFKTSLNQKEKIILEERIMSEDPSTFDKLGAQLIISKQRVKQIEVIVKERLQKFLGRDFEPINSGAMRIVSGNV